MTTEETIRKKFSALSPALDEKQRRLFAAAEAKAIGRGGIAIVHRATGLARDTIRDGIADLRKPRLLTDGRVRRPGAGRKTVCATDPELLGLLLGLVEPVERGDPESPLRWSCKSTRTLAAELGVAGHCVSHATVGALLRAQGFSLQANNKSKEGTSHDDRDAQFRHIDAKVRERIAARQPVVSVDTKKRELVGQFKNSGREYRRQGDPRKVKVHDFVIPGLGRASPYGVYDIDANEGFVSVGIDRDTAAFAVASIRRWWETMGRRRYPKGKRLLVTADCGGSNGARVRLWKVELQKMADETGMDITVCHFPPGTSKWNKIEHRLFSFISQNWRGRPLVSHAVIVKLIAATKTTKGLKVACELDRTSYPKGIKVTRAQMAALRIEQDAFHGEWNYTLRPRKL